MSLALLFGGSWIRGESRTCIAELALLTVRSAWRGVLHLQELLLTPPTPLLFLSGRV